MPRGEKALMGFFLALSLAMTLLALDFKLPEARSFPLIVGSVTSALIVIYFVIKRSHKLSTRFRAYIVDDLFMQIDAEAHTDEDAGPPPETLRRERILIVMLAGFGLVTWLIGLTVAVPLFLVVMMRGFSRESWKITWLVTAGTCGFLYVVFVEILRMRLHFGLFGAI